MQSTWDYYFRGQGQGPLLVDARLCTEVGATGERHLDCLTELPGGDAKAGTTVYVWQSYLVPRGDTVDDLRVEVRQGDVLRATRDVTVRGEGWRSRSSVKVTLGRPGTWTLSILRGNQTLRRFEVKVSP